jgi:hypothetical protein
MSLQDLTLTVQARANVAQAPTNALTLTGVLNFSRGLSYRPGAGAGQADRLYHEKLTVPGSGNLDLDLTGGSLKDVDGNTLTLARVKGLIVVADAANEHNIVVGGADSNAWVGPFGADTDTIEVQPDGQLSFWTPSETGWPVTAGTGDILRLANAGANDVVCEVLIVGSAA